MGTATDHTPLDTWLARVGEGEDDGRGAAERFAARHDAGSLAGGAYAELLPAAPPGPGQQYAFAVDLDACTGCKACVTACHSLNGLDDDESWRRVGTLRGTSTDQVSQHTVTTACHHCVEPACLIGCPANAYDKDPVTGIVVHLDDQCIGCGYCTFTCPYEVPRLNERLGIVRKCDLCTGRLAAGEAPACAQACPNGAITVEVVDVADVVERSRAGALVPGAPASSHTCPTTTYRSREPLAEGLQAADHTSVRPSKGHPPLATMLVLTQVAVGALLAAPVAGDARLVAPAAGALALGASVAHLGRPLQAWRAVLNVRRSWLSREVVAFGAFAALAALAAVTGLAAVATAAAVAGVAGVVASVLVYVATGRPCWDLPTTAVRFGGTTAVGGLAVAFALATRDGDPAAGTVGFALVAATLAKLTWEASTLRHLRDAHLTDRRRAALLVTGDLAGTATLRVLLGSAGALAALAVVSTLPATGSSPAAAVAAAVVALALIGGELAERWLFFTAATTARMPGGIR
jgi:Fe-S-cluster-containing dehydrogenase component/DMSO reductase anchor subunit